MVATNSDLGFTQSKIAIGIRFALVWSRVGGRKKQSSTGETETRSLGAVGGCVATSELGPGEDFEEFCGVCLWLWLLKKLYYLVICSLGSHAIAFPHLHQEQATLHTLHRSEERRLT